jgi:hypothetical protein
VATSTLQASSPQRALRDRDYQCKTIRQSAMRFRSVRVLRQRDFLSRLRGGLGGRELNSPHQRISRALQFALSMKACRQRAAKLGGLAMLRTGSAKPKP